MATPATAPAPQLAPSPHLSSRRRPTTGASQKYADQAIFQFSSRFLQPPETWGSSDQNAQAQDSWGSSAAQSAAPTVAGNGNQKPATGGFNANAAPFKPSGGCKLRVSQGILYAMFLQQALIRRSKTRKSTTVEASESSLYKMKCRSPPDSEAHEAAQKEHLVNSAPRIPCGRALKKPGL